MLLEQSRRFTGCGKTSGAFFFEEEFASFTNLKDAALAGNESDFLVGHGLDFNRHTVGFGEVVSLGAVFDLDHGAVKMELFLIFANEKLLGIKHLVLAR